MENQEMNQLKNNEENIKENPGNIEINLEEYL